MFSFLTSVTFIFIRAITLTFFPPLPYSRIFFCDSALEDLGEIPRHSLPERCSFDELSEICRFLKVPLLSCVWITRPHIAEFPALPLSLCNLWSWPLAEASVVVEDKTVQAAFLLFWNFCLFSIRLTSYTYRSPTAPWVTYLGAFNMLTSARFSAWRLLAAFLFLFSFGFVFFLTSFCLPVLWGHLFVQSPSITGLHVSSAVC